MSSAALVRRMAAACMVARLGRWQRVIFANETPSRDVEHDAFVKLLSASTVTTPVVSICRRPLVAMQELLRVRLLLQVFD
jgi:hypothetical protein